MEHWILVKRCHPRSRPSRGLGRFRTEGTAFTDPVATLAGISSDDFSQLTAIVTWYKGATPVLIDNTSATAQNGYITFDGSTATVMGTNTYQEYGLDAIRTALYLGGHEIALVDSLATVAAAAISVTVATGLQFTNGSISYQPVATFTDAGGDEALTDYGATIQCDGGNPTAALIGARLAGCSRSMPTARRILAMPPIIPSR